MHSFDVIQKIVYVTLLCAVMCFDWSTQEKLHMQIKPQSVLELRQQAESCAKESGVPADNLKKIIDKTLPNDKQHMQFFLCVTSSTGYFDKDGHSVPEKFLTMKLVDVSEEHIVNTMKECNKVTKSDPLETAHEVSECIHEKYHFSVLK